MKQIFNKSQLEISWEKFIDPQHEEIYLPISLKEECGGNFVWKRFNEYVADYFLLKEISIKNPSKNISKFKKFIYEMYFQESCPIEFKKKKKNENSNSKKESISGNYTSENKKLFKTFFRFFEKSDLDVVKLFGKDDFSYNREEELEIKKQQSKVNWIGGSSILLEEKSSFFNKWISSILQFVKEFDITDEVKYFFKTYLFK